MKLVSCFIENFKSISGEQNKIIFEENVTTIIGKNESGKSNILEAIGIMSFLKPLPTSYLNNLTRNCSNSVQLCIEFDFWDWEKKSWEYLRILQS